MAVLNRFETLLRQKKAAEDREITLIEVSAETGISRDTLSRYAGQKITLYNSNVVDKLCRYFGVDVGTLLYLSEKSDHQS